MMPASLYNMVAFSILRLHYRMDLILSNTIGHLYKSCTQVPNTGFVSENLQTNRISNNRVNIFDNLSIVTMTAATA